MRQAEKEKMETKQEKKERKQKLPKEPKEPKQPKERRVKEKPPRHPGMEKRSLGDLLRSRVTIGVICIVIAVLIAFVAVPVVERMMSARAPVVVAAMEIEKGTLITAEMVKQSDISVSDLPVGAVQDTGLVIGKYAAVDLVEQDIVTGRKLSDAQPLSNPYLYDIPAGKQAISVDVAGLSEGLSGKLKSGDVVTVYAAFSEADAKLDYFALRPPELRYVKVLAVSNSSGNDIDVDKAVSAEGEATDTLPSTITLLVDEAQAAALAGLNRNAALHVSLAARADNAGLCAELLAAQEEYLAAMEEEEAEETADNTAVPKSVTGDGFESGEQSGSPEEQAETAAEGAAEQEGNNG